jgi:hypothetical protein
MMSFYDSRLEGHDMTKPLMKAFALAMLLAAGAATAQEKLRINPGEGMVFTPRYQPAPASSAASEGHCILKVWVDDRATVMLRGDQIGVRTESGKEARDQGSFCSGPLPERVENFRIEHSNAPVGGRVVNLDPPSPRNNYTGSVSIDDPRDGGRIYVLDVWWNDADYGRNSAPRVATNPGYGVYPSSSDGYFDEEAACQAQIRNEIQQRNRGRVEVDFRANVRKEERGGGNDRIRGWGTISRRDDSARFGYECIVDDRRNQVVSASYEVRGDNSFR